MKIETKWNLGNFTVSLLAEANEAVDQTLRNLGLLYLGQRVSKVDRILGGFEKKGDKFVRKEKWKRTDTEYTPELAKALAEVFGTLEVPMGDETEALLACAVEVTAYTPTKSEPKFQREKLKFAEKESSEKGLEAWLKDFCGYTGATHTEDGEGYATEALATAKLAIDKFIASNI